MPQKSEIPRTPSNDAEVEYYKSIARLAEERAREIRRISALERAHLEERLREQQPTIDAYAAELEHLKKTCECLEANASHLEKTCERLRTNSKRLKSELATAKAQLKKLRRIQHRIAQSRAHRLAEAYMRYAAGNAVIVRAVRLALPLARVLSRLRRAQKSSGSVDHG